MEKNGSTNTTTTLEKNEEGQNDDTLRTALHEELGISHAEIDAGFAQAAAEEVDLDYEPGGRSLFSWIWLFATIPFWLIAFPWIALWFLTFGSPSGRSRRGKPQEPASSPVRYWSLGQGFLAWQWQPRAKQELPPTPLEVELPIKKRSISLKNVLSMVAFSAFIIVVLAGALGYSIGKGYITIPADWFGAEDAAETRLRELEKQPASDNPRGEEWLRSLERSSSTD